VWCVFSDGHDIKVSGGMAYLSNSEEISRESEKNRGTWSFVLLLDFILFALKTSGFLSIGAVEKSESILNHAIHSSVALAVVFLLSLLIVYFSTSDRLDISVALAVTAYSYTISICFAYMAIQTWNDDSEDFDETVTFIIACVSVVVDLMVYSISRYGSWLFETEEERYLLENGNGTEDRSHDSDVVNNSDISSVQINVLSVIVFVTIDGWYNLGLVFTSTSRFFELFPYKHSACIINTVFCIVGIFASLVTAKAIVMLAMAGRTHNEGSQSVSYSAPVDPKLAFPADLVGKSSRNRSAGRSWSPILER